MDDRRWVLLGLSGELPERVEPERIECLVNGIRDSGLLVLASIRIIPFDKSLDLIFNKQVTLPRIPMPSRCELLMIWEG
jgi:L-serine dehydratase